MRSSFRKAVCFLIALAISACAESSVPTQSSDSLSLESSSTSSARRLTHGSIGNEHPVDIIVFPFATSVAEVTLNQGLGPRIYQNYSAEEEQSTSQLQLAQSTAQNICIEVANSLANKGWNAACQPRGIPLTAGNALIVDGAFTDQSEGNRQGRPVIGLGAGTSTLDTRVGLYRYSNGNATQLLTFTTHADVGKTPAAGGTEAEGGAGATTIGVDAGAAAVKNTTSAIAYLTDQSARQIAAQVTSYFSQQAMLPRLPVADDAAGLIVGMAFKR
jgi:hypothetical protein